MNHPRKTAQRRKTPWGLLAIVVAPPLILLALWLWPSSDAERDAPPHAETPVTEVTSSSKTISTREVHRRVPTSPKPVKVASTAGPSVGTACWQGDVFDVDAQGTRVAHRQDCGDQRCKAGACLEPDPEGCDLPEAGVCVAGAVEACHAGRRRRIACLEGQRCAMGPEGAHCIAETDDDCDWIGGLCEGAELVRCVEGRLTRTECEGLEGTGRCVETDTARCVEIQFLEPEELEPTCGGCGCESSSDPVPEVCDGIDNDGNDFIDDDVVCDSVPIVAFLVTGRGGGSHSEADIEAEIDRVNAVFAGPDVELPLFFELDDVRVIDRDDFLELSDADFDEIIRGRGVYLDRDDFYIPVVFTDEVVLGGAPKLGVSTLPNGRCGRRRRAGRAQVPFGLIAVSKARSPTTVAHEIGHFLGLCHTHEPEGDVPVPVVASPGADTGTACSVCALDGDGMCDTPRDPGPPVCGYSRSCAVACEGDSAEPDASNLMSYYTSCRGRVTLEQQAEVRRNAALRRAWAPCLDGRCACDPRTPSCPEEMSCRPDANGTARCALHGGVAGGETCRGEGDCVAGHLCASVAGDAPRCRPICHSDAGGCDCRPVAGSFSVCR